MARWVMGYVQKPAKGDVLVSGRQCTLIRGHTEPCDLAQDCRRTRCSCRGVAGAGQVQDVMVMWGSRVMGYLEHQLPDDLATCLPPINRYGKHNLTHRYRKT
jgi:hypothetical protein